MRGFFIALIGCLVFIASAGSARAQDRDNDTGLTEHGLPPMENAAPSPVLLEDGAVSEQAMPSKGPDVGKPPQLPPNSEDSNNILPSVESPVAPVPAQNRGSETQNDAPPPPPPEAPQSFHK